MKSTQHYCKGPLYDRYVTSNWQTTGMLVIYGRTGMELVNNSWNAYVGSSCHEILGLVFHAITRKNSPLVERFGTFYLQSYNEAMWVRIPPESYEFSLKNFFIRMHVHLFLFPTYERKGEVRNNKIELLIEGGRVPVHSVCSSCREQSLYVPRVFNKYN